MIANSYEFVGHGYNHYGVSTKKGLLGRDWRSWKSLSPEIYIFKTRMVPDGGVMEMRYFEKNILNREFWETFHKLLWS